jgi:hypothetical protein
MTLFTQLGRSEGIPDNSRNEIDPSRFFRVARGPAQQLAVHAEKPTDGHINTFPFPEHTLYFSKCVVGLLWMMKRFRIVS